MNLSYEQPTYKFYQGQDLNSFQDTQKFYNDDFKMPDLAGEQNNKQALPQALIQIDNRLKATQTKLTIDGIDIYFPYVPYQPQIDYMKSVIQALNNNSNALLQSPTGTGKTLCLLCASLAWLANYREKNFGKKNIENIRIIYTSRTHSQLKQVIKELKSTCYRPVTSIIGSRDYLCIKQEYQMLKGAALNANCKRARIIEKSCQFYHKVEGKGRVGLINQFQNEIVDIEELHKLGYKNKFCPFYFSRIILEQADLVFMPYNYILEQRYRENFENKIQSGILIFDEAHNIEQNAEDGASINFGINDLNNCEVEIKMIYDKQEYDKEKCLIKSEDIFNVSTPIISFNNFLKKYLNQFQKQQSSSHKQSAYEENQQEINQVFDGMQLYTMIVENTKENKNGNMQQFMVSNNSFSGGLNLQNYKHYLSLLVNCIEELSTLTTKGGLVAWGHLIQTVFSLFQQNIALLKCPNPSEWQKNHINRYKLYIHDDPLEKGNLILSFWCMDPGITFNNIYSSKPRSIILTSGTLAPLSVFESELKIPFLVKLNNSHVIDPKTQLIAGVLTKGPSGNNLNFSYNNRLNEQPMYDIGYTIANMSRIIPNGILVFFPSYTLLNKCYEIWSNENLIQKIQEFKTLVKEPKNNNLYQEIIKTYERESKGKGAVLLAVCKGRSSEGIDFSDDMARAVFLVGIPFPSTQDKKIDLKKQYLESLSKLSSNQKRLNGQEWYLLQATRATNQAIGRVIRHINDYGVILLCDIRFNQQDQLNNLPQWINQNIKIFNNFQDSFKQIAPFFKERKLIPKTITYSPPTPINNIQVSEYNNNNNNIIENKQINWNLMEQTKKRKPEIVQEIQNEKRNFSINFNTKVQRQKKKTLFESTPSPPQQQTQLLQSNLSTTQKKEIQSQLNFTKIRKNHDFFGIDTLVQKNNNKNSNSNQDVNGGQSVSGEIVNQIGQITEQQKFEPKDIFAQRKNTGLNKKTLNLT